MISATSKLASRPPQSETESPGRRPSQAGFTDLTARLDLGTSRSARLVRYHPARRLPSWSSQGLTEPAAHRP